jgi:hypothetical protein
MSPLRSSSEQCIEQEPLRVSLYQERCGLFNTEPQAAFSYFLSCYMIEHEYQVLSGAEKHAVVIGDRVIKSPPKIKVTLPKLVRDCLRHVYFSTWP